MQVTRIWMVRHAPVDVQYLYGQMDVDADVSDTTSFQWLSNQLPARFSAFSSDLVRCRQTLGTLLPYGHELEMHTSSSLLREQSFGDWEGLSYRQIEEKYSDLYIRFWENPVENAPPGGESFSEVVDRSSQYFNSVLEDTKSDDVVFFVHAGTIRSLLAHVLEIEPAKSQLFDIEPLSLSRVTLYRQDSTLSWKLDWVNRVS